MKKITPLQAAGAVAAGVLGSILFGTGHGMLALMLALILGLISLLVRGVDWSRTPKATPLPKRCIVTGCPVQAVPGLMVCHRHRGDR